MKQSQTVLITGLPLDATQEEVLSFAKKCGMVLEDPQTGESMLSASVNTRIICVVSMLSFFNRRTVCLID
jgi:RNA recognition motif-containing protein